MVSLRFLIRMLRMANDPGKTHSEHRVNSHAGIELPVGPGPSRVQETADWQALPQQSAPLPGGWRRPRAVAERHRRRCKKAGAIVRVGFALHRGFDVGYHLVVAPVTPRGLCDRACVFAPNSRYRAHITPARRSRRRKADSNQPGPERRQAMTWAQRLKRVLSIDIESCSQDDSAILRDRESGHSETVFDH